MCGIFCYISRGNEEDCHEKCLNDYRRKVQKRGPDHSKETQITNESYKITFYACVLWTQGTKLTEQPIETEHSVLLYNGDIYGGLENHDDLKNLGDTSTFLKVLETVGDCSQPSGTESVTVGNCSEQLESLSLTDGERSGRSETVGNRSERLETLEGPFAFIYYDKIREKLYFGRDKYGRVSLLIGTSHGGVVVTSVATQITDSYFTDVPPLGVFCLNLRTNQVSLSPYGTSNGLPERLERLEMVLKCKITISYHEGYGTIKPFDDMGPFNHGVPPSSDINGGDGTIQPFDGMRTTTIPTEKLGLEPSCHIKEVDGTVQPFDGMVPSNREELFERLLSNPAWYRRVQRLKTLLTDSVRKRTTNHPNRCNRCTRPCTDNHCTVGILFSGGLDCTILTVLTDRFVDRSQPVDLINMSFGDRCGPDRSTGLSSLEELRRLCPGREWRFLEVDVGRGELEEGREGAVMDLVYPLDTVLDDSLGCAMWFAAGTSRSSCRILLVGTGADELFGGYTKHRVAFKRASWCGLQESLDYDWRNLPHRNLGRDNRVIADHGRQMRTPYLDEGVVEFVRNLPCWEKMFLSDEFPKGTGDKLLLRLLAYDLGLKSASSLPKRALQFGSRIANRKENAHEVCPRLIRKK